jgi:putative endonuclease
VSPRAIAASSGGIAQRRGRRMSYLRRRNPTGAGVRTPRQRAGDAAEAQACARLEAAGCRILGRNVRFREGEIDIVADDGGTLVFVEVRMRRSDGFGGAVGSVDAFKRRRLVRAAQHFLLQHYGTGSRLPPCRFDVVTADGDGIREWIRDAFAAD